MTTEITTGNIEPFVTENEKVIIDFMHLGADRAK